jgi:hypothetical protein
MVLQWKGEIDPMGWRSKFMFLLIVYFAGFATAVYCLAPAPETAKGESQGTALLDSVLRSDRLANSFNSGMHKCIDMSKDAAIRAAELIQAKIEEAQRQAKEQTPS